MRAKGLGPGELDAWVAAAHQLMRKIPPKNHTEREANKRASQGDQLIVPPRLLASVQRRGHSRTKRRRPH